MTSVARIDLERIECAPVISPSHTTNAGSLHSIRYVAITPEARDALVHAVKAAQTYVEADNLGLVGSRLNAKGLLLAALRPFTEEPGQFERDFYVGDKPFVGELIYPELNAPTQNDDLGDALRPSESNGGEPTDG